MCTMLVEVKIISSLASSSSNFQGGHTGREAGPSPPARHGNAVLIMWRVGEFFVCKHAEQAAAPKAQDLLEQRHVRGSRKKQQDDTSIHVSAAEAGEGFRGRFLRHRAFRCFSSLRDKQCSNHFSPHFFCPIIILHTQELQ